MIIQVGDIVRCIDNIGCHTELEVGKLYEVKKIDADSMVKVVPKGFKYAFQHRRFVVVEPMVAEVFRARKRKGKREQV